MAIPSSNDQGGIFASINITPLTDIFLVLLIIFMVATAITIESAAHVDLPRLEAPTQHQQPKGVTVSYTSDHQIFVNGRHVSEGELAGAVHDALAQSTDKTVVFNGDPSVILGDMVRILDVAKSAGAGGIALAVSGNGSTEGESSQTPLPGGQPMPEPAEPGAEPVAPSD
jgi:biopolymer transport protein ExbD